MKCKETMKNKSKAAVALCLIMALLVTALTGCGAGAEKSQEDILSEMKEFATPDGSASIYLNKDWEVQDLGLEEAGIDFWMCVASEDESEVAVLMQFPKTGANAMNVDIDGVKDMVEESYGFISDGKEAETPEVPGMSNLEAATGTMQIDSSKADAYVVYGETDYAYYALMYGANSMSKSILAEAKAAFSKFAENVPEEEDNTTVELSDTVRWFNASYAILTEINGWDYNRFAGLAANEENMALEQQSLEEWWGVTDRASADETLDWILTEGHRADFAENMAYLQENGIQDVAEAERADFVMEYFYVDEDQAQSMADAYAYYEQYGPNAIDGWDYCRAMNLLSFYYLAGYYNEQEALDKSLEIAQTMQPLFTSWDELADSYLRGYEYWAEESSDERRAVYDDLKSRDDNPYAVDYNTALEKTW